MTTRTIDTTNSAGSSPCTPEAHQRADVVAVKARVACNLIDAALVLVGQVISGEKNPTVLKTAADHLEYAKRMINQR